MPWEAALEMAKRQKEKRKKFIFRRSTVQEMLKVILQAEEGN